VFKGTHDCYYLPPQHKLDVGTSQTLAGFLPSHPAHMIVLLMAPRMCKRCIRYKFFCKQLVNSTHTTTLCCVAVNLMMSSVS